MSNPLSKKELLLWALQHPSFAHTVHVNDIRDSMADARRSSGPRITNGRGEIVNEPSKPAYVKIGVDDGIVVALNGPPEKSPYIFLLVAVPTQAEEHAEARIVIPGET